jgi:hypothetical protein
MSEAAAEPQIDSTFGIVIQESETAPVSVESAPAPAADSKESATFNESIVPPRTDVVVVLPPPGGSSESKALDGDEVPRSRASTEQNEWQFSLERLRSHKVESHGQHSPRVHHFYKRQNELIDNLIAWHDDVRNGTTESQEDVGALASSASPLVLAFVVSCVPVVCLRQVLVGA